MVNHEEPPVSRKEGNEVHRRPSLFWQRGRGEFCGKKLELPIFQGKDLYGWVFRAKRYFTMNEIEDEEWILAASVCMEGRALGWFQWVDTHDSFTSWRDLRTAIIQRFSRAREGELTERLMSLKHIEGVADYHDMFESLAVSIKGVPK